MTSSGTSFKSLLAASPDPILLPSAHDALSARLIEQAGFEGLSISGSSLLAARLGLPDLGLVGLAEMASGVADILSATTLPALVDGDDGYGDEQAVAHMIVTYQAFGAAAVTIEDQIGGMKRPGQGSAVALVDRRTIAAKIRAAVSARQSDDFWIVGRTDAYTTEGLDEAIARGAEMREAGADAIFVAGIKEVDALEHVARRLAPTPLVAVHYGGQGWPNLPTDQLGSLGYKLIVHPLVLLPSVALLIERNLAALSASTTPGERPIDIADLDAGMALLRTATRQSERTR